LIDAGTDDRQSACYDGRHAFHFLITFGVAKMKTSHRASVGENPGTGGSPAKDSWKPHIVKFETAELVASGESDGARRPSVTESCRPAKAAKRRVDDLARIMSLRYSVVEGDMKSQVGKRVGGAIYVHRSAVDLLPEDALKAISLAEGRVDASAWNVVRAAADSVSFLSYESFDEVGFPALLTSAKVDLASGDVSRTDYRGRANPPILHRKELLLSPDDSRLPRFRALTAAAAEHGLFRESSKIGTRAAWEARIAAAGLVLRGHSLLAIEEEHVEVSRHRTAIVRGAVSQPMQAMLRLGVVATDRSVFDYGCGQGEDVAALSAQGYEAFGWDPHHAAEGPRRPADVVNLGFVLNVIEDPRERVETLKAAWGFAVRALCVAVMAQGKVATEGQKPHRDGFLTSRGTFQKYFTQHELRDLVGAATGQQPLSVAQGIVAVFKDKELEQEVLLRHRSRAFLASTVPRPPRRERIFVASAGMRERLAPVLESLRELAVSLGRLPEPEEVPSEANAGLASLRVSWPRAMDALRNDLATDGGFADAVRTRREDLLVHFALLQFPGSPKYRSLPRSIRADIKSFFGSNSAVQEEARGFLFAAGDRSGVRSDVEAAIASGLGGMRGERVFRFLATSLARLPARLRVLVGCAEVLQGGLDACDFVDVDLDAPRISMVVCDDVARPVPFVVERIKVDLGRLKVSVDRREPETTPVYFKSRYLPFDHPGRDGQAMVETAMAETNLFGADAREPEWSSVKAALAGTVPNL
jgi:DNA phosphorothioation-associated putative methyltransferase